MFKDKAEIRVKMVFDDLSDDLHWLAICGGPNLPLCAPLQPASPVLAVI